MSSRDITVVLPAKNEAGGIATLVAAVQPYCSEVIVVDGHSSDATLELARAAGARVLLDNRKGKGDAYRVGLEAASHEYVVFMDADGSHEPADIPVLVEPLRDGRAQLVVASRHRGGSDEWSGDLDTWLRAIGSGFLSVAINSRWNSNLTDVLNGFRAVRRSTALTVPFRALDFDVEQHMIVQFLKRGHRVCEVRSHEYVRRWGQSKLPTFRKAHLFFWRLFVDLVTGA